MIPGSLNRRVTPPSSREVMGEVEKRTPPRKLQTTPPGFPDGAACPWRFPRFYQAETRAGSSTMEKRTPALWRFSSETARQASSASLRVLKGPCTWAEPSTSLWKFIDPNSPPITQKLLVVMTSLLLLPVSRTGSSCCGRRPPSERLHRRNIPCDRRRYRSRPCSDAWRRRYPDGSPDAEHSSHSPACPARRNTPSRDYQSTELPCDRSAT